MKALILAGGYGTRLAEETEVKPKPMAEIGGKPILWHIMKIYSHYGINEFVILLGYKGYVIKEYFANYFLHQSDVTIDLAQNKMEMHANSSEPWKVTLIDTGLDTMTGGRVARARQHVGDQPFLLTYGDGVSDIDIGALLAFHQSSGGLVTLTSVQPEGRFGAVELGSNDRVTGFLEKPEGDGQWINGGFFVCQPGLFELLEHDGTILEREPLQTLASRGQLHAYRHSGFWRPMDTLRDKLYLNDLWRRNQAPWKVWS
ncbi:glucose-1-phosphate cytidylyltransferase [bacterium]|nr:glucose-1-phosphate cytidylyltransferase [bacterium]